MYHVGMQPNAYLKDRPCIYGIRNLVNNKIYVGKTKCIYRRCAQYIYDFKWRKLNHINDYLYNAMFKVGLDNFDMFPLEFVEIDNMVEKELSWMQILDSTNRDKGYNIRMDSSTGMITSEETSIKIRNNLKNQWANGVRDGHSDKMKESWSTDYVRRENQSALLSKIKTKYTYRITHPDGKVENGDYYLLSTLELKSCLSNFNRQKQNKVNCKGYVVERFSLGEQ